jgi:hypothetical protein
MIPLENQMETELTNEIKNIKTEEKNQSSIQTIEDSNEAKYQPSKKQKVENNKQIMKNFEHLVEFGEVNYRISTSISSFEEYERIVIGKISPHLEGRNAKIEYLDPLFNEWAICDDMNIIPEKGRIRITFQG